MIRLFKSGYSESELRKYAEEYGQEALIKFNELLQLLKKNKVNIAVSWTNANQNVQDGQKIEEKDKQIERLYSMLDKEREQSKEKDKTIQEYAEHIREQEKRLADLLEQSQQLNHNNQVLLLKEKESKTKGLFKRLFAKSEE